MLQSFKTYCTIIYAALASDKRWGKKNKQQLISLVGNRESKYLQHPKPNTAIY